MCTRRFLRLLLMALLPLLAILLFATSTASAASLAPTCMSNSATDCTASSSVVGSGSAGSNTFSIDAQGTSQAATGSVSFDLAIGHVGGTVSFLCVSGNTAVLSGSIVSGPFTGSGFNLYVLVGNPDLLRLEIVGVIPLGCPTFNIFPPAAVTQGSITITSTPVTFASLSALTKQDILGSGHPGAEGVANALLATLDAAASAQARGDMAAKAGALKAYVNQVKAAQGAGFLTETQAATLTTQAGCL